MAVLPTGTLTLMLTDLVASTRTWEAQPPAMRQAMARHDEIVYESVERHRGVMVESGRAGDSIFAVFRAAKDAAACALEIQRRFRSADWSEAVALKIRIGLHTGEVELRAGHYFGPPLNRCARMLALCHGGQTLATEATRQLLVEDPPADVELTDLGLHLLKDIARPERTFQLTDLRYPERFPPLRSRAASLTNLTAALSAFVGRERELAELRALVREVRLLTLTGVGGSGKTRLAAQLAMSVVDDMAGGVWLVELAPVSDGRLLPRTVATALDVEEQQGRPLVDTLVDRCRGPELLLVLDNCEHLLDAAAELVERLLASCPDLRIVVTSREPLNLPGETTWLVPPLAISDAVRLFTVRARSRSLHFELSERDAPAAADICRRVDGIPLAIELAAARTATLPLGEVQRRLDRGLALLTGGSRTGPRRQRTLEATIDWSYDLLSEGERRLFRRLAVFVGRFSIGAVEAVCAASDPAGDLALEQLSQLVSKSLVQRAGDGYLCLETIRAYARAKLVESGEMDALRAAHARYFLSVAESRRPGALASYLDAVEEDHADMREALRWCIGADPEMGARLSQALFPFWLLRGYALEARAFLEQIVAALPETSAARTRALLETSGFSYTAGDFAGATRMIDEAVARVRSLDDEILARALVLQGSLSVASGDAKAERSLTEALDLSRRTGNALREAEALHHLGTLALVRGDHDHARELYGESLAVRRRDGRLDEAETTFALRAFAEMLTNDLERARQDISEALTLSLALRDHRAAWSLDVLACLAALAGDAEGALRLSGAARSLFESTAQRPPAAWARFAEPPVSRVRASLGEAAALAELERGRAMSFDEALHYALDWIASRNSGK